MKVLVDIEGIIGFVQCPIAWFPTQVFLHLGHERVKVALVTLVKGLGQFGEDKLTKDRVFGGDDARGIAPVEFAHGRLPGWQAFLGGCVV
ncbi:MAG: hypothetical protein R3C14_32245 [Caldilineaceae bacterium]